MAGKDGERSASSATRFTATTPHASSKFGSGAAAPKPRFMPSAAPRGPRTPLSAGSPSEGTETPEQRVARLRSAHEAAKNAKVSRFDQILAKSRPFFDSAHRVTVISLVGLTAIAGLMTAYTAYDMLRHNRQRKLDFLEAQKRMAADSLEAARLAYMRGDATDEQIAMVDEANTRVDDFQMPSILSAPKPLANRPSEQSTPPPAAAAAPDAQPQSTSSKLWGLFSSSKKAEEPNATDAAAAAPQPPRSLEEKRAMLESARAAFEKEKENQQRGGPLDRVGTEVPAASAIQPENAQPKKKGWLW